MQHFEAFRSCRGCKTPTNWRRRTSGARHPQPGEVGVPECRDWNPFTSGKLLKGGRLEFRDRSVGAFVPGTMGVCKPIVPTSPECVQAKLEHNGFIESLGG
jgi:hypothetical protein